MNGKWYVVSVLLITAVLISACGSAPAPSGPVVGGLISSSVTGDDLKNGTYEVQDLGSVKLSGGSYEQKYGEGATMVNKVGLLTTAIGDLDKDGAKDAAVILWVNTGGSGTFIHLVVVSHKNKTLYQVGSDFLGDRTNIKSLAIEGGKIVVQMLDFGPNDPKCCPSVAKTRTFQQKSGVLSEVK